MGCNECSDSSCSMCRAESKMVEALTDVLEAADLTEKDGLEFVDWFERELHAPWLNVPICKN